jgi:CRP-like cAMP-binding protein
MAKKSEDNPDIPSQVRTLRRLLALSIIEGKKQRDQIRLLFLAGLDRNEIAELVGTTPLTVSVEISNMRKKGTIRGSKRQ